jgi:hypothetical protein
MCRNKTIILIFYTHICMYFKALNTLPVAITNAPLKR